MGIIIIVTKEKEWFDHIVKLVKITLGQNSLDCKQACKTDLRHSIEQYNPYCIIVDDGVIESENDAKEIAKLSEIAPHSRRIILTSDFNEYLKFIKLEDFSFAFNKKQLTSETMKRAIKKDENKNSGSENSFHDSEEVSNLLRMGEISHEMVDEVLKQIDVVSALIDRSRKLDISVISSKELLPQILNRAFEITEKVNEFGRNFTSLVSDNVEEKVVLTSFKNLFSTALNFYQSKVKRHGINLSLSSETESLSFDCKPNAMSKVLVDLLSISLENIKNEREKEIIIEARLTDFGVEIIISTKGQHHFSSTLSLVKKSAIQRIVRTHNGVLTTNVVPGQQRYVVFIPRYHTDSMLKSH